MKTRRSKVRRRINMRRLAHAVRAPGIDPRAWVAAGRVETDPDAATFEPKLGWLVDVKLYGGTLDGVEGLPCRWLSIGPGGDGFGEYIPPKLGGEVLVAVTDGDVEANPVILGTLTNEEDAAPPTEINGLPIDPEATASTPAAVSPLDTEIKRSPHSRREHFDGELHEQGKKVVITADEMIAGLLLGSPQALKSYVKGEDLATAIGVFVDALAAMLDTGANSGGAVVFAGKPAFAAAAAALKTSLSGPGVLSQKIKGE